MKKTTIKSLILSTLIPFIFLSCTSNKSIEPIEIDDYSNEDTQIELEQKQKISKSTSDNQAATKKSSQSSLINYYEEGFKDLITFGNKNKFVRSDVSSVFSTTVTGALKQQESTIFISTKSDLAGFGSSYMAAYYILLMDENSRKKLSIAYDNYLADFNNKKLNRKNSKSYKQYGKANVSLNWGAIKTTTPNNGTGDAYFGYEFKKNSPYFVITCFPVYNKYYEVVTESTTKESMLIKYYFTKAQLKELLTLISEEKIYETLLENNIFIKEVESDYYSEEYYDESETEVEINSEIESEDEIEE